MDEDEAPWPCSVRVAGALTWVTSTLTVAVSNLGPIHLGPGC
jgi:hypothetical protein